MKTRFLPLLFLLGACRALGPGDPDAIGAATPASAARHIQLAEAERAAADYATALDRLAELLEVGGLAPTDRDRASGLRERTAEEALAFYSGDQFTSEDLEDLYDLDLAPRLRARAGTRAAEKLYAEGSRVGAFSMLKKVEDALPSHPERAFAANLLATIGFDLAADDGTYRLLFSYRQRGIEALEYLVLTYPFQSRCDEAYDTLARIYEERDNLDMAVARFEDLLLYHQSSPYAPYARWRLPAVRMKRLERDDYDRSELVIALRELDEWLMRHSGHELQPEVERDLQTCHERLANSDLINARYYRRIHEPFGAKLHAERALQIATAGGIEVAVREARAILDEIADEESADSEGSADDPLPAEDPLREEGPR